MPGALLMCAAIFLYGWGALDLVRLAVAAAVHLVVGWVYLIRQPLVLAAASRRRRRRKIRSRDCVSPAVCLVSGHDVFSGPLSRPRCSCSPACVLGGCLPSTPRDEEKEPYFLAGKSRVNTMDFKGAIESFEKAVEVNPKSAPAHFELGWLYDQKEPDPAAAIYHYERYLKLSPNSGKEEMVKTRILACKQQLAQTVSLGPGTEKQQREFEQLAEENKRLHEDIEKWRAYAAPAASS